MEVISQEQDLVDIHRNETVAGPKLRLFCLVLFFVAVACTYLQWYPHDYRSFKVEDSGLFLHIGQRLTHGDVLYRDIADNKPPLIYWLNEFGLLLGHGSPGGVFLLCLAAGIFTFAVVYWGLRHYVGWPLFVIAGCWSQLAFLTCAFHPNYTESFALPLVALAAVLFVRELLNGERITSYALAQGALAALLFSLRANNIGISIIYVVSLLLELKKAGRFRQLCLFAVAAVAVYGLLLVPLALQGTLPDYYLYVFRMAGPYTAGTTIAARVHAFWHGVSLFDTSPLLYFSFACAATAVLSRRHFARHIEALLWMAAWLALEMVMSSTSGYHWNHYYLLWILPLTVGLMLGGSILFQRGSSPMLPVILAATLILVVMNEAAMNLYRAWSYPRGEDPALTLARPFIRTGDRVTTWGYFYHDLWFDLDHRPGTRWFHEGAYTNRKIYQALLPMVLSDLEQNRPRVVIERRSMVPLFAPANPKQPLNDAFQPEYFEGWDDAAIAKRKANLAQHYYPVAEKSGVVVFLRRD